MKYLFSLICALTGYCCCAQQSGYDASDDIPYRPRIGEVTLNTLYNYQTASESAAFGEGASEIEVDQQIKLRLGVPIIMKENTLMGLQLKYDNHDFTVNHQHPENTALYEHVKHARFKNLGARFMINQTLAENKELTIVVGAEIKSDRLEFNENTSKTYVNVNYRVQKNNRVRMGGGIAVCYTHKVPQVYPIFFYENKISRKWTVDLALPKSAVMRLKVNPKTYLSFKAEVKGWRYAIHNTALSEQNPLTIRKSDVHFGINFEREIYDWLWLGIDTGFAKNLRNYIAAPGDRRRDAIVDVNAGDAPYTTFSIFFVPPKKIYKQ
ncbi:MAG: DUF6268 family outer membrane beta-barrel protein [Fulvivirga sp.]|nr:DUF6268 family outer membrane beta-barrel protein [Fulvivirga sp.]